VLRFDVAARENNLLLYLCVCTAVHVAYHKALQFQTAIRVHFND